MNMQTISSPPLKSLTVDDDVIFKHRHQILMGKIIYISEPNSISVLSSTKKIFNLEQEHILAKTNIKQPIYKFQYHQHLKIIHTLTKIFEKNNIPHVFTKSLPTYLYLYKVHPNHLLSDIDLLIKKQHYNHVKKILNKLGFYNLPHAEKNSSQVHFHKFKPHINPTIDVHFAPSIGFTRIPSLNHLIPQSKITSYLINNIQHIHLNHLKNTTIPIPILKPKAMFVLFNLHLFHHVQNYYQIKLINDLIKKNERQINSKTMLDTILNLEIHNLIYFSMTIVHRLYPSTTSQEILNTLISYISPTTRIITRYLRIIPQNLFLKRYDDNNPMKRIISLFAISPKPLKEKTTAFINPKILKEIKQVKRYKKNLYNIPPSLPFLIPAT